MTYDSHRVLFLGGVGATPNPLINSRGHNNMIVIGSYFWGVWAPTLFKASGMPGSPPRGKRQGEGGM